MRFITYFFLFFFAACVAKSDTSYYLTHPEEIQTIYDQCLQNDKQGQPITTECSAMFRAIPTVKLYLTELINSPEQFGLEIMSAQNQLVALEAVYNDAIKKTSDYQIIKSAKAAVDKQRLEVQSRYALIRMVRNME